tara:strand:- start:2171 stop:2494 length:324 start_codon:yes stop_codon:yes gene_type:complete
MKIQVTEEHIKNGQPENCEGCAIALAVRDSLKADSVSVTINSNDNVEISSWSKDLHYDVGIIDSSQGEVNHFVEDFDSYYGWDGDKSINTSELDKVVYPFEFEVNYG